MIDSVTKFIIYYLSRNVPRNTIYGDGPSVLDSGNGKFNLEQVSENWSSIMLE